MYDPHLRSRRERRGWSLVWLAQALGSTVDLIAQWEEGSALPSHAMQAALNQLFGGTDQSLEPVVEVNNSSQNNSLTFLLLPHANPADL